MTNDRTGRSAGLRRSAVFLDRDGTIIEDGGYIDHPDQARLCAGAREALRRMRRAGHVLIVASNQSGVARGLFDERAVDEVNARITSLLGGEAAPDAFYYCPYLDGPEAVVAAYRRDSDWRKPKPGMLLAAAQEHGIDLARSWMIGDAPRDVEAGRRAGCRTILLAPDGAPDAGGAGADHVVATLREAADIVEAFVNEQQGGKPDAPQEPGSAELLRDIHRQLDLMQRRQRQGDFSYLRLIGTLAQLLAGVAAAWGLVGLLAGPSADAAPRLLLACFLQLVCLTILLGDRA